MSEWAKKKLRRMYYKRLKAGFISYEEYIRKLKELDSKI